MGDPAPDVPRAAGEPPPLPGAADLDRTDRLRAAPLFPPAGRRERLFPPGRAGCYVPACTSGQTGWISRRMRAHVTISAPHRSPASFQPPPQQITAPAVGVWLLFQGKVALKILIPLLLTVGSSKGICCVHMGSFLLLTSWSVGAEHFPTCRGSALEMVFSSNCTFSSSGLTIVYL